MGIAYIEVSRNILWKGHLGNRVGNDIKEHAKLRCIQHSVHMNRCMDFDIFGWHKLNLKDNQSLQCTQVDNWAIFQCKKVDMSKFQLYFAYGIEN